MATLSEESVKYLAEKLAEVVTKNTNAALVDQYVVFAQQKFELAEAQKELARKDAVIADLQGRIAQLSALVSGAHGYNPYNNGGPAPVGTFYLPVSPQAAPPAPQQFAPPVVAAPVPAGS